MTRGTRAVALALLLAGPAAAQEITLQPLAPAAPALPSLQRASTAPGANLRLLDKVTGLSQDVTLLNGQIARLETIDVELGECRYPSGNRAGDAFAFVTIRDRRAAIEEAELFSGWMIASSPGLSALDHPRYDVWVLRCANTS
ncbi:MAG: DUF2155 domain-containing protein [Shimia sp.]